MKEKKVAEYLASVKMREGKELDEVAIMQFARK